MEIGMDTTRESERLAFAAAMFGYRRELEAGFQVVFRGDVALAAFLAWYFRVEVRERYEYGGFRWALPGLLHDAVEMLQARYGYCREVIRGLISLEHLEELPRPGDLTDPAAGSDRHHVIWLLARAASRAVALMDDPGLFMECRLEQDVWTAEHVSGYFHARDRAMGQAFQSFTQRVLRRGLRGMMDACESRGMSGTFGRTDLRSYYLAGRVGLTFARKLQSGSERTASFVGEDRPGLDLLGRPHENQMGLMSLEADWREAIDMIEEVTRLWPADEEEQRRCFRPDGAVGLALRAMPPDDELAPVAEA
jgi:hypothetical protein